jgi:hypothetical protein
MMVLFIEIESNRNQNGLVGYPKFCSKLDNRRKRGIKEVGLLY